MLQGTYYEKVLNNRTLIVFSKILLVHFSKEKKKKKRIRFIFENTQDMSRVIKHHVLRYVIDSLTEVERLIIG